MPFRARIKRAFGKSDKDPPSPPEAQVGAPVPLPHLQELPRHSLEATPVADVNSSSPASVHIAAVEEPIEEPQPLALQDLWSNAYAQLQDEEPGLIAAYEQNLIASQQEEHRSQLPSEATDVSRQKSLQQLVQRRLDEIEKSRLKVSVGGREIAVRDQARRVVHAVLSVKDMIDLAVSVEPHASLAWAGVMVFLNPVANAFTQEDDALDGFDAGPLGDLGAALRSRIVMMYAQVLKYQIRLAKHYGHSTFFRSLRDLAVTDNWKDMLLTITDMEKGISGDLEIVAGHTIRGIDRKVEELGHLMNESLRVANETRDEVKASKQLYLLESLPWATGAIFGSFEDQHKPLCLEGTQTHTLKQIGDWCKDPEAKPIFWLKGMAGTGKTTISRTFASACRDGTPLVAPEYSLPHTFYLAASFFFDRTKPDRNNAGKVFPTISRTLADVLPDLRDHICEAITKNPNIGNESLSRQWEHLIFQPLMEWERQQELLPLVLIFVLDAMDECQNERDLRLIFQLMSQVRQFKTIRLRVLITSRPEVPEVLDKVSTTVTGEDDITIYIMHELAEIRKKHPGSEDWPEPAKTKMLIEQSDGLFIYAATACRFLAGARSRSQLDKRLDMIFDRRIAGASPQGSLDQIYTHILQFAISGEDILEEEKEELANLFRQSVGSIIILFEPIGVAALSGLLGMSQPSIEDTIQNLHSLLAVPADDQMPVKLLHLSFRDFLLDSERCLDPGFRVDEAKQHETLLHRCLEIMSSGLRQDICSLGHPGALATEVDPLIVAQCIPAHLHYACVHWINHLKGSKAQPGDHGSVYTFLKTHFLYWLEAMALIGKSGDGVQKIRELWDYLSSSPSNAHSEVLRQLVYDATRFSLTFKGIIATAPLQTYASALVFTPETSVIRRLFTGLIPSWVCQLPTVDAHWDALVQTLEGHSGFVNEVDFSPDGRFLASASSDGTVRLWAISTGEAVHVWENKPRVWRVSFSPNGRILAAAFSDLPMRLWDIETGALLNELGDYSAEVMVVKWLSNGRTLVSTSRTGRFALWDVETGGLLRCIDLGDGFGHVACISPAGDLVAWLDYMGNTLHLSSVNGGSTTEPKVFQVSGHGADISPGGKLLAFKSSGDGLGIWDVDTGQLVRRVEGLEGEFNHVGWMNAVAFSPDGTLVAAVKETNSGNGKLRLWDVASGSLLHSFTLYRDSVRAVKFSADGSRVLCTLAQLGLRVWDVTTGSPLQTLSHPNITDVKISPEGGYVATASTDHTIRIWDATVLSPATPEKQNEDGVDLTEIEALVRSPQGDLIALVFSCGRVEVRRVASGNCVSQFHPEGYVGMIAFSPIGKYIVSHSSDRTPVCVWDVQAGVMLHAFGKGSLWFSVVFLDDERLAAAGKILQEHEWNCHASDPIKVHIWDPTIGALDDTLAGDPMDIDEMAFAPDGALLATVSKDKSKSESIFLWDVPKRVQLRRLERPEYYSIGSKTLIFSPGNRFLAAAAENRTGLSLWDVPSGKLLQVLKIPGSGKRTVAFSPDGNSIAASSADKGTVIWDVLTGINLWRYEGPCMFDILSFSREDTLETSWGQVDLACFRESTPSEKNLDADPLISPLEWASEQRDESFDEHSDERFEEGTQGLYEHAHEQGYGRGYKEDNMTSSVEGYDKSNEETTEVTEDPAKEAYTSHTPSLVDEQTPDSGRDQLHKPSRAGAEKRLANPLNMFIQGPWVMQGTQRALLLPSKYQAKYVAAHEGAFTLIDTADRVHNFVLGPVE
ncbi:hypothetical protein BDV11DRAFT_174791 [Aspergillus similis]